MTRAQRMRGLAVATVTTDIGVAAAALVLALPAPAQAHGLAGRADLPVPRWLFAWAAATVLIVSFVALGVLWRRARLHDERLRPLVRLPAFLEPVYGVIGVAMFAGLVYAGFAGSQVPTANVVPTFVFVIFWVALAPLSALCGDLFRAFNPWRAFARATGWLATRGGRRLPAPMPYPERLGCWPAAIGLVGFGWLELAATDGEVPGLLAKLLLAYAAIQMVGMALYGVERWTERGDAFAVYFGMFASLAPLTVRGGRLLRRRPLSGLSRLSWPPGTVQFLCAAIGITAFDGASGGELWTSVATNAQPWLTDDVGLSVGLANQTIATAGLALSIAIAAGFYYLGVAGIRRVDGERGVRELASHFAPSLVPLVLAYLVAHYFSFLVFQGQAAFYLVSDPLGDGADLLGTAGYVIDYGVVSMATVWYVQVAALVAGHAAGLAVAHDRALALYGSSQKATRSQYWMLVVMVGFTSLGLWLLSEAAA